MTPILYESHMHTPLCKHAIGEPSEYAAIAEQRGLKGIIITCHNPIPNGWSSDVRMAPEEFKKYVELVQRTRKEWEGRIDVRLGMESDFVPGMEDYLEKLHKSQPFHHILGSVHPQVPDYLDRYFTGDWFEYQKLYFEHIAQAAESGLYDTMAHPDLVKNLAPEEWHIDRIWPHILRSLDRVAETGVAMELNTSGMNKRIAEMNPSAPILHEMHERGIPVVIGADAHVPERVADAYEDAMDHLEEAGYSQISFFLDRERQDLAIGDARKSLKKSALSF